MLDWSVPAFKVGTQPAKHQKSGALPRERGVALRPGLPNRDLLAASDAIGDSSMCWPTASAPTTTYRVRYCGKHSGVLLKRRPWYCTKWWLELCLILFGSWMAAKIPAIVKTIEAS